jgi:dethiobiotin synthetase/adenosylmethionine--8-amino-7-oxononanoate aminotransferase
LYLACLACLPCHAFFLLWPPNHLCLCTFPASYLSLQLAKQLLGTVGSGWAARVFYSDNGSTAIEVALKMAFRKYMADHQLLEEGGSGDSNSSGGGSSGSSSLPELAVVGLQEGYHGDTLGAMDAVAPSPFNGRLQTPWYTGRGLFLDPPTVALQQGAWRVRLPADMQAAAAGAAAAPAAEVQFGSQAEVFALPQRMVAGPSGQQQQSLYSLYRSHIQQQLEQYSQQQGQQRRLGALILEPVLQGAGGMRLIDPLYQIALVEVCRQVAPNRRRGSAEDSALLPLLPPTCACLYSADGAALRCIALPVACREAGMPVIFDEVFTGFWRLGATSGGALLGVHPDIACCAKLMTGGLVPLAATLAGEAVFAAFEGDSKMSALLHGHSYTAHAVGCAAGVAALRLYRDPGVNPNWCTPEAPDRCQQQQQGGGGGGGCGCSAPCGRLLPLWDEAAVAALSQHPLVQGVVPLGTVLAVQLRSEDGAGGYASNAAAAVVRRLRQVGVFGRPLGDVVYLMVTPMTEHQQCADLLGKLAAALDAPAA